ncbi:plasmalemma vesicle-associated protein [Perognathus longimembris pacificus]|uniref:plasmalemma vesicle-associated protein n=1 Tax=Perognathus longimembris pacificus TaxID=214514 RepID=UPI0020186C0C|nr:plasmalemma vesicle-associated protein [Perognathus longimembris pacificus]
MGLAAERPFQPRGCWYYLRYFFLFASLTQLLVILGLVLFMVYGNPHTATEANLRATQARADALFGQVQDLGALHANLSRQLNLTAQARDAIMQLLLGVRRDLDRINASYRQCQTEVANYKSKERFVIAIVLSEQRCLEELQQTNKSCEALQHNLEARIGALQAQLMREHAAAMKDHTELEQAQRMVAEQLAQCKGAQERLQAEARRAEERLRTVRDLCLVLDKDKFEADLRALWRDSIIPRTLDTLGFGYHPLGSELASVRRSCDLLPGLMASKVDELARNLRAGIERVARENAELERQKLAAEQSLQASQEAQEKAQKEARAREAQLQAECAQRAQRALEEKAALQSERDHLAKELEARKREVEDLKMQVAFRVEALDTCLKAKTPPVVLPRPMVPGPQPPPIDPASLDDFKKRILESQRLPAPASG